MLRLTATRWAVSFDKCPLDVVADVFNCIENCLITIHAVESRVWVTMDFYIDDPMTPLVIADAIHAMEQAGADVKLRIERADRETDRDQSLCRSCGATGSDDQPGPAFVKDPDGFEYCGPCYALMEVASCD